MKRMLFFLYGVIAYLIFFGTILYFIGFMGNLFVPVSLDSAPTSSIGYALGINLLLLTIFSLQHTGMARQSFKNWLTKFIPEPIERSTYVLVSSIALGALMFFWQPLGGVIWSTTNPTAVVILHVLFFSGWGILFMSSFLINHFELFGLSQVYYNLLQKEPPKVPFKVPFLYKIVRHPMMFGVLLGLWCTPTMTISHLVCALGFTAYIIIGTTYEERDLVTRYGDFYRKYQARVPKLLPIPTGKKPASPELQPNQAEA